MRPVGTTTPDSSVAGSDTAGGQAYGDSKYSSNGSGNGDGAATAGGDGVEMVGGTDVGYYDDDGVGGGGGEGEVSTPCCCGGLSPTAIVYMSAFVSSLTSVLLGYGECACLRNGCVRVRVCACAAAAAAGGIVLWQVHANGDRY